jgi:hypothetical protein
VSDSVFGHSDVSRLLFGRHPESAHVALPTANPVTVTLTADELIAAAHVGVMRRARALDKGRQHRHGYDGADNWSVHIEAAGAELAFAKAVNRYWADSPAPDYHGDVGKRTQVRHTLRAGGCLIAHPDDPDDYALILVTGQLPVFSVRGWLWGRECKREQWWRTDTGRPAFFVPQDALRGVKPRPQIGVAGNA